ncbi:CRISPR-associated RAMP protein [Methanohalophilus sp. RSK]|nr:CRISPR-associated RAMP protein [Methanohalophilus sp. RSK]
MEIKQSQGKIIMFRKLVDRAILQYKVTTKSDLHIGGHTAVEPAEVDNPVIKNTEGYPIIPGSSLKGVMRTEVERLLKGLDIKVCDIFDNKQRGGCNECPVCYLFGGKDLASSIRIKDAVADHKKTSIRDGVAIDRQTRKARTGGKYDTEAVPRGTIFKGTITIENTGIESDGYLYDHAKLGGLLGLIDFFNACSGNIGHAASRGFGEVEIEIEKLSLITAQDYLDGKYKGSEYSPQTDEYQDLKSNAAADWSKYVKEDKHVCQEG